MEAYFFALVDRLQAGLRGEEVLLCAYTGEGSDFARFNRGKVRQAGHVRQQAIGLDLIAGRRHASADFDLQGHLDADLPRLERALEALRERRAHLPEDPHLGYATTVQSSSVRLPNRLPDRDEAIEAILARAEGLDLVGIWASGTIERGFANSLGQRNWHEVGSFNLDWSCYLEADRAAKANYAGFDWSADELARRMALVRGQLDAIGRPRKTITPGEYRAFLAPLALVDIMEMLAWGGFGLKSHRTAQTPLIKMVTEGRRLDPRVTITEDNVRGFAPRFTRAGFVKPDSVTLIDRGGYRDCLTDARSAKEYGATVNSDDESPLSLAMAGGDLAEPAALAALDTGLLVNNLWYCNYSDRNDCRITGMTRFACFWVEDGVVLAPIEPMRFDDSVYRMLGDNLVDLTRDTTLIMDPHSYGQRSVRSHRLPGALLSGLRLTL